MYFAAAITSPFIYQTSNTFAGPVTGQTMTIAAQSMIGTPGALTGGALIVKGGNSSGSGTVCIAGAATFQGGDVSGAYTTSGTGGLATFRGGDVAGASTLPATGGKTSVLGGAATSAGGAGSTAQGGHVLIAGGVASGAVVSNLSGNVAFHADPASWQNGVKVMWIGKSVTSPTGGTADGYFLYMDPVSGKLCAKSPAGVVTEIAA
jgi:hypothetical protein